MPSLTEKLLLDYHALDLPAQHERSAFLDTHAASITVAVTSAFAGVDTDLMTSLPNLRAVVNFGVGYDGTDTDLAATRGISVSNTPDVLTDCVADATVGLLIDTVRGLSAADRFVRAGRWPSEQAFPLARRVSGSRVGIVGLGRIGAAIADRLSAFGCEISYHNRHPVARSPYTHIRSMVELADTVDILVVAASGGPGTRQLVDRTVLEALGPAGYLINIARGSVVDQDALVALLVAGRLAGAGLDVFNDEPRVPEALWALDNVVLLPHIASATIETRAAMQALTLRNLDQFLATGTVATPTAPRPRGCR